jgi:flagellar basal-body rod modification protein FlgD
MAIASLGAAPVTTGTPTNASLGQDDFMRILLTQLQFQDPLKPMDNQQFIAQMAQFTSLELNRQANDKTDTLLTIQTATQALSLIGKQVAINTDTGVLDGQITDVRFQNGQPSMTLKTPAGTFMTDVRLSQISLVRV